MKRIDIYTIDIGGGHIAPAQALKAQFDRMGRRDLDVRVVNVGIVMRARFLRSTYKLYWNWALRYPPMINAFYRGADTPFLIKMVDRLFGITILPRFARYIEREKPDMVVSTYFTFTHYLELLKRVGQLDAITVVLNPEPFDSHRIWFSRSFDWSLVFSEKSRREIIAKGIPARSVKVFPFPIKDAAARRGRRRSGPSRGSKVALRRELGLETGPFTVLLFFGAEGIGPVWRYAGAIADRGLDMQVVIVCGRNEKLRADMEHFCSGRSCTARFVVRGYVSNLADYIAAADVVVGKSGPNQVFETLAEGRPLVISSFLANEKETTDWVIRNRAGWLTRTPDGLARLLEKLAARPALLREYEKSIRALGIRSGAPEICRFLAGLLEEGKKRRKRPVADAIRRIRDAVAAEAAAAAERRAPRRAALAARRRERVLRLAGARSTRSGSPSRAPRG